MRNMDIKVKRIIAFMIDFLVYGVVWAIFSPVLLVSLYPYAIEEHQKPLFVGILIVVGALPMILRDLGVSLGKRIMKIRVYALNGEPATWTRRLLRNLLIWALLEIEVILLIVNERRLGDIIAKTIVQNKDMRVQTDG